MTENPHLLRTRRHRRGRLLAFLFALAVSHAGAQRLMENLDRGVVAVRKSSSEAYVSWRLLGLDPADTTFNVHRSTNGGPWITLNSSPLAGGTNYTDSTATLSQPTRYRVQPVFGGIAQDASDPVSVWDHYTRDIPLQRPAGGTTPDAVEFTYSPNDASVADLDGDGEYEIVLKWNPSNAKDNAHAGYTGNVLIDAYEMDGTFLWRVDLGANIRAGAHYTQFMVYDLDCDGRAELVCKTADGTTDAAGAVLGNPAADWRNTSGRILDGPEYLSAFDGVTGAFIDTVPYVPGRGNVNDWGDNYGNRVDRFLACVAYLGGRKPSVIMSRGYYTRTVLAAWDLVDGKLVQRWVFDSATSGNSAFGGQGCHSLSVADVDADGFDEIIFGAATIDHDGTGMHSTGRGHGDALHVSDMDPNRPGLEAWMPHEGSASGATLRDAATGQILLEHLNTGDVARGVAAHIDANHPGYQVWSYATGGVFNTDGTQISTNHSSHMMNFLVWWTGDLQREFLNCADGAGRSPVMEKWNGNGTSRLLSLYSIPNQYDTKSINSTKANPCLSGDILGDWREEIIYHTGDDSHLRIFTTTTPTDTRIHTLMHDPQYRVAMAWQNVGYNQPPHPGFYIGAGMAPPPVPDIHYIGALPPPPAPENLVATAFSSRRIDLTWSDTSDIELGTRIERSADGLPFVEIATLPADTTSYPDTGLTESTTYTYRVRAFHENGASDPSAGATATTLAPPVPVTVSATLSGVTRPDQPGPSLATSASFGMAGGNAVALLVTCESTAGATVQASFAGQPMTLGISTSEGAQWAGVFHLLNPSVTSGSFVITTTAASAQCAYSAIALANVDRVAGTDAVANTSSGGTITLRPSTAVDSGHLLIAAVNNAFNSGNPPPSFVSGNADQLLLPSTFINSSGHLHCHGAIPVAGPATNDIGNTVQRNAFVALAFDAAPAPVVTPPPAAPTGLAATAADGSVTLVWNGASGEAENHTVYRSATSGGEFSAIASNIHENGFTDTAVSNGTRYYYVVTASDATAGESDPSAETSALPLSPEQEWRILHFETIADEGDSADAADPDLDGTPNWAERTLRLDPRDPASAFRATIGTSSADAHTLRWKNAPGVTFVVRSATELDGVWRTDATLPGSETPETLAHPVPRDGATRFYRIGVVRP